MNNIISKQLSIASWILFMGLLIGASTMRAQSGTVSVDFKNTAPKEIIKSLESQTPYKFIYQKDINLDDPKITLQKKNVSIDEILKNLQVLTNLNFLRNENNIAINKKTNPKKPGKITGKVVDNTALSLPGATVSILENGYSTITDNDGNYSFSLEPGTYTLEISFVSFQTQKITGVKVSENDITPLNVALKEDAESLKEVVITKTYQKATASVEGMLLEQKKAAQFSDGISAEQIARTPDKDVGATLKRIT
ncbi:carboxypeptidase regulatory-like domain-containing protein, partial [Flavobacterium sp.]|uniref:DUF4974 domain-containing protein n=1 Tax=Flavobacterium sp. TaxID=239 RepID=UPI003C56F00C